MLALLSAVIMMLSSISFPAAQIVFAAEDADAPQTVAQQSEEVREEETIDNIPAQEVKEEPAQEKKEENNAPVQEVKETPVQEVKEAPAAEAKAQEETKQEEAVKAEPAAEAVQNVEPAAPVKTYKITWKNADGTVLAVDTVEEGTVPVYSGETPVKAETDTYMYEFAGWTITPVAAASNKTYTAKFTSLKKYFTITWKNADGTVLEIDENVPRGTIPTYDGATPEKAETATSTYVFSGWTTAVTEATSNKTYKAKFTEEKKVLKQYKVTVHFVNVLQTNGTMKEYTSTNNLTANTTWTITQKTADNKVLYKRISVNGTIYEYTGTWQFADGTILNGSYTIRGAELTEDRDIYLSPVYEQKEIWHLNYRYIDNVSTGSGSWSNQGEFSSFTHTFKAPANPAHYRFVEWKDAANGNTYNAGDKYRFPDEYKVYGLTTNVNIYAVWQPSVTVVYHSAGAQQGVEVEKYEDIAINENGSSAAHNGLTFLGWYDAAGRKIADGQTAQLPAETTEKVTRTVMHVYAHYAAAIEAADAQKVYGEEDSALEASVKGNDSKDQIGFELVREEGEDAGEYEIRIENVKAAAYPDGTQKYEIRTVNGRFEILPRALTVTVQDAEKTYGEEDPEFEAVVGQMVGEDDAALIRYELVREDGEDAGEYAILAEGEQVQGNYMVTYEAAVFTILRKEAVVTADSFTKTTKDSDPEFTAQVEGLIGEDEIAYTLTRENGTEAGEYEIRAEGEAIQGNYSVTYIPGILTIEEAPAEVIAEEPRTLIPAPADPVRPSAETAPEAEEENVQIMNAAVPMAYKAAKDSNMVQIADAAVPMAAAPKQFWALANLLCTIATGLISLMMLVFWFGTKRDEEDEEEEERKVNRKGLVRILSLIPAAGAVIAFLLTENMANPMQMTDKWTLLMVLILAANIIMMLFAKKKVEEKEEEEA